jgi:hypothetical protein
MTKEELNKLVNELDTVLRKYGFEHMEEMKYRNNDTDIIIEFIKNKDNL